MKTPVYRTRSPNRNLGASNLPKALVDKLGRAPLVIMHAIPNSKVVKRYRKEP